jgi:hypothetical protein
MPSTDGGRDGLYLLEESAGSVLPLRVYSFKLNQAVSPIGKAMFLA